jgi:hypothetical protein
VYRKIEDSKKTTYRQKNIYRVYMKEINEYTGNIKLQWNGETETCLHELFLSSGTSHAITRELGENDNQHYHFYLSGCTILVKSLRDKILKLLPQLKQPHLKDKTNKDEKKIVTGKQK